MGAIKTSDIKAALAARKSPPSFRCFIIDGDACTDSNTGQAVPITVARSAVAAGHALIIEIVDPTPRT